MSGPEPVGAVGGGAPAAPVQGAQGPEGAQAPQGPYTDSRGVDASGIPRGTIVTEAAVDAEIAKIKDPAERAEAEQNRNFYALLSSIDSTQPMTPELAAVRENIQAIWAKAGEAKPGEPAFEAAQNEANAYCGEVLENLRAAERDGVVTQTPVEVDPAALGFDIRDIQINPQVGIISVEAQGNATNTATLDKILAEGTKGSPALQDAREAAFAQGGAAGQEAFDGKVLSVMRAAEADATPQDKGRYLEATSGGGWFMALAMAIGKINQNAMDVVMEQANVVANMDQSDPDQNNAFAFENAKLNGALQQMQLLAQQGGSIISGSGDAMRKLAGG